MKLAKCLPCNTFITFEKNEIKRHEAAYHAYQISNYEPFHGRSLNDNEFNVIVVQGEEKFKHALFIPDNPINLRCRRTGHGQQ